jgi:hypothetical protein
MLQTSIHLLNLVYPDSSCCRDKINRAAGRRSVGSVFCSPFIKFTVTSKWRFHYRDSYVIGFYRDQTPCVHLPGLAKNSPTLTRTAPNYTTEPLAVRSRAKSSITQSLINFLMKSLIFISACLIINSCAISLSDMKHKIGNGYYYLGEGVTQRYIYHSSDERSQSIDEISIWPTVCSFEYDENFIIVKQAPNEKAIKQFLIFFEDKSSESTDSLMKTDKSFINMLAADTCYWIIIKKTMVTNGPFNYPDFIKQRQLLGVPIKLKLYRD